MEDELIETPVQRRPSIVGAVASACAFVVVAVAAAVVARPLQDDRVVIRFVRRNQIDWVLDLARGYSTILAPTVVVVLAVAGASVLAVRDRRAGRPAALVGAVLAAVVVAETVKRLADRPRPPVGWQLAGPETTPAFPSTHVAALTAFTVTVIGVSTAMRSRARFVAYVAATLVCGAMAAARTYLCMTWASDTVGGLLLGVATALAAVWAVDRMTYSRRLSPMP